MAVGAYRIDYYPDLNGSPEGTAKVAAGIAMHTGNPVHVWSSHPSEDDPTPSNFAVYPNSDLEHVTHLIRVLVQS